MSAGSFADVYAHTMQLFRAERYRDILDFLDQEGYVQLLGELTTVTYLRSCAAARMGDAQRAIGFLQEALGRGVWYGEELVRKTPSWQTLQDRPDFEQLAEIFLARERAAYAEPLLTVERPATANEERRLPTFLALHGNADSATEAIACWRPVVSSGWLLAAPQSSQMAASDLHGWFDVPAAILEVSAQYEVLARSCTLDAEHLVLAGFSMGGELALRLILEGVIPARGFLLLAPAGMLNGPRDAWDTLIKAATVHRVRGYILCGADDGIVRHEDVLALSHSLTENGIPCGVEMIAGLGHEYPPDASLLLRRALQFIFP